MKKGANREVRTFFYGCPLTVFTCSPQTCRSRLAGDGTLTITATFKNAIAGKPAPTVGQRYSWHKKRATEVAQNALRAHVTWKELRFFPLVRVFPDKNSKSYKKQHHEADRQHSGEYHIIDKHDRPPVLALLR
ncbi:hypothetical protein HX792_03380 [Pseudomonas sp. B6002]|nr:hypothetical protein [Pseudomonas sp. B6002]